MRIDKRLNFVVPIEDDAGSITAYVHAAPISREVFDLHFMLLGQTFTAIYGQGLGYLAGPRLAANLLRTLAKSQDKVEEADVLLREVVRLSNVVTPGRPDTVPLQQALVEGLINADDAAEVENALAFFTVASWMHKRREVAGILDGAGQLWGARTLSLSCTEFAASLLTSTGAPPTPKVE